MARRAGPQSDFAISARVSQTDINRALRTLDRYQGADLHKRVERAHRAGATLLRVPIAANTPSWKNGTGRTRDSVKVKKLRNQPGEITAWYVGPRTFYSQWLQDGTSRGIKGQPWVERATESRRGQIESFIEQQVRRLA